MAYRREDARLRREAELLEEELLETQRRSREAEEARQEALVLEQRKAQELRDEAAAALRVQQERAAEEVVEARRRRAAEELRREEASAERRKSISQLVAACSQAAARAERLRRQLANAERRQQLEVQALEAQAHLESRRWAQEQQLKRAQIQVLRAEVAELELVEEEHRACAARAAREAAVRREAAERRRRLLARQAEPEEPRLRRAGASAPGATATLSALRQQSAADAQRGEAQKAQLRQELEALRCRRSRRQEEFEGLEMEVVMLQEENEQKAQKLEVEEEEDSCLRASLEMATAEELHQQQLELSINAEAAWPGGCRSRYLEADRLDGIRRNGRTKTTRPEVKEQPNLARTETGSPDEEARRSDGFANPSPSPTGNTKQDTQTLPSLDAEAQPHRMTRPALGRKQEPRLTFGSSDGVQACGKKYANQLESFWGALVQADHRWIGADAGHRIQIVDCSLGLEGELGVDGFIKEVYGRLDAVLSQRDGWETRFRELEAFVEENGRLPRRRRAASDDDEIVLSNWLRTQGSRVTSQQMPAHRLQRLLNARSDLVRRRAEGWMAGGLVGRFQRKCRELKEYIEMNGKLPTKTQTKRKSSSYQLAKWLQNVRTSGAHVIPKRRKMLEEVHPLVKELLQKRDNSPFKINRVKWERQLEKVLHIVEKHRRLPKMKTERTEYKWLWMQLRRLDTLPPELAKRLRGSHPLVAEAARRPSSTAELLRPWPATELVQRGRRGSRLLLGLVGVLGAMRLMAERMEVGFAGSEERDAAFMERLRCLAREALSWAWLTPQQRLVWAAAIELDAVPLQEHFGTGDTGLALEDQRILEDLKISRDDV
ncbi:unnamed protein product [Durusdinium trenchii]|uniref:Uncharacterized protein n=2 Tax=Durusdinium trenchii TaxID=1381693 RepID=A0ABP0P105_9DINO